MGDKSILKKCYVFLFLAACFLSSACSDNTISCKSGTSVILKDKYALSIKIQFFFNNKKEMRSFKYKEKEVLFALRLALKQHKSSMLRKKGRNNVNNTIIAICKRRLNNKFSRIKIIDYNFTNTNLHTTVTYRPYSNLYSA